MKWPVVTLGEICQFEYGKSLPASTRSAGGISVFGANGPVGEHNAALTNGATIIIGRKGSIGEVNFSSAECWPIDTTYFIDQSSTKQDLRWLFHLLKNLDFKSLNRATGVPGLNRNDAYACQIPLPPLSEQKRIAGILDQADALRRLRARALDRLNALGQAIFQEMFGDPRSNDKGWPICKLSEMGELERGVSKHRPRNDPVLLGGDHPLIQTGDISRAYDYIETFSSTYSDIGLNQSRKWKKGILCITIAANIADTAILDFEACFPDSVVGFDSGSEEMNFFIHRWFATVKSYLEQIAPTVAQKNINLAILRELPVISPNKHLIFEYFKREQEIRQKINLLIAAYDQSASLFFSLQHRAFRGEL